MRSRKSQYLKKTISILTATIVLLASSILVLPFNTMRVSAANYVYIGSRSYASLAEAISAASSGATITLKGNISSGSTMLNCTKSLTINGNGYTITGRGLNLTNSGTTVTLKSVTWNGGGTSTSASYFFQTASGTTLNLQNGATLTNFSVGTTSTMAVIHNTGTFNMYDGSKLSSLSGLYGTIRLDASGATFNMYGGTIENGSSMNTSSSSYHEGVVLYVMGGSTVNMYGGVIKNNSYGSYAVPGVIFLHANGTNKFNMTGGLITGNAASYGGAVYNNGSNNTISVSGSAQIYSNRGASLSPKYVSNIYLKTGQLVTLGSSHMGSDSSVGVYTEEAITLTKDVMFAKNATFADAAHFQSDYSSYAGIMYCDGKYDYAVSGQKVEGCHTNHVAGSLWLSTQTAHDHAWEYVKTAQNEVRVYCSNQYGFKLCGNNGADHAAILKLDTEDSYYSYDYQGATLRNDVTAALGSYVSNIEYYKVDTEGATTGGVFVEKPRKVGYYYGKVSATINGNNYTIVDSFKITREPTGFNTEELSNMKDAEGDLVKVVRGNDASTDLKVKLTSSADTIKIYKIADSNWDSVAEEYDSPIWIEAVQNWINSSEYKGSAYQSIESLQNVSTSIWKGFFADMLKNTGNLISSGGITELDSSFTRNYRSDEDPSYCYLEDVPFGTYAIIGVDSGGQDMDPVIVNVYPQMDGPAYNNFVKTVIVTTLKKADVQLTKKINNEAIAIVEKDEVVHFSIEYDMPPIPGDRVSLPEGAAGITKYTLEFIDEMSQAFEQDDTTLKIEYSSDNGSSWSTFTNEEVTYRAFTTAAYSGTKTQIQAGQDPSYYEALTYDSSYNTALTGNYYTNMTGKLYALNNEEDVDDDRVAINRMTLTFNPGALKSWLSREDTPSTITDIRITYDAKITDQFEPGTENNYNKATISYESNASGTSVTPISDTVYAYSYAIQIIKINGDTAVLPDGSANPNPEYLNNAHFDIYKEAEVFVDGTWDYGYGDTELTDTTLEAYRTANPNLYYYTVEETEDEVDAAGNITESTTHSITRVFKLYVHDVVSTKTAEGVLVNGVPNGNYILREIQKPDGFNMLAEDILFSINLLSDEDAELLMGGSYRAFRDAGGTLIENGIYTLKVLNYSGLQLPSTGGMGTFLFTLIGILIMGGALLMIIIKRKNA